MIRGLQPWLAPWADYLLQHARGVRVTSTFRSYSEQLNLWLNRSRNPYPVAPPGRSSHQYGRAFDVVGDSRTLAALGALWTRWGGRWSPRDQIHFEA